MHVLVQEAGCESVFSSLNVVKDFCVPKVVPVRRSWSYWLIAVRKEKRREKLKKSHNWCSLASWPQTSVAEGHEKLYNCWDWQKTDCFWATYWSANIGHTRTKCNNGSHWSYIIHHSCERKWIMKNQLWRNAINIDHLYFSLCTWMSEKRNGCRRRSRNLVKWVKTQKLTAPCKRWMRTMENSGESWSPNSKSFAANSAFQHVLLENNTGCEKMREVNWGGDRPQGFSTTMNVLLTVNPVHRLISMFIVSHEAVLKLQNSSVLKSGFHLDPFPRRKEKAWEDTSFIFYLK